MLKASLLYLSHSERIPALIAQYDFSRRVASRFIAGEALSEGIAAVKEINSRGMLASLDCLGENSSTPEEACRATDAYGEVLEAISESQVRSNISVKLTQLGIDISQELCLNNLGRILVRAEQTNNFVRIDMESSAYTKRTLDIFRLLASEHPNVGIVIQAYLYRSANDLAQLIDMGANIRLCKGAYQEPGEIAYPKKKDVDANYVTLMEMLFSEEARRKGVHPAIATHDQRMVDWAKRYASTHNISTDRFEFQMLYGIRRDLQQELADEGYTVRVYVPFGTQWYPYFMRRLAERPANLLFVLKNLFKG